MGPQPRVQVVHQRDVGRVIQGGALGNQAQALQQALGGLVTALGEKDLAAFLVQGEVARLDDALARSGIGFAFLALSGGDKLVWIGAVIFEGFSGGMANAAMVAWASRLTNPIATAAQFALLSSLMTLVAGLLGGFSGLAVEALQKETGSEMSGYASWFSVTPFAAIPPLLLIWLISRLKKTVRA